MLKFILEYCVCRVVDRLEREGLVTDRISEGDTKFMGVCKLDKSQHYRYIMKARDKMRQNFFQDSLGLKGLLLTIQKFTFKKKVFRLVFSKRCS